MKGHGVSTAVGALSLMAVTTACERGPDPISDEALRNATYSAPGEDADSVTLTDGEYLLMAENGATPRLHVRLVQHSAGDIDGDGDEDAAVILAQNTGDRTILLYLHALVREGRRTTDVASRLVGDRVYVRGLRVEEGVIEADLTIRRSGEAAVVEPSLPVTTRYVLTDRGLMQVTVPAESAESATSVPDDARGALTRSEWELVSVRTPEGELTPPAPAEADARPSLSFQEELRDPGASSGRLQGSTGCNLVFGDYRATAAGELTVRSLATTERGCPRSWREIERRVRAGLSTARAFSLSGDELEVSFDEGSLRFRRDAERSPGSGGTAPGPGPEPGPGASP